MKPYVKTLMIGALLTSGVAVAAPFGGPPQGGYGCGMGGAQRMMGAGTDMGPRYERMAERLGLSAEQRTAVRQTLDQAAPRMRELKEAMRSKRQELRTIAQGGPADEAQVRRLAREQGELKAEMILQRQRLAGEIDKVLTDAQREELKQMRGRMGPRFRG